MISCHLDIGLLPTWKLQVKSPGTHMNSPHAHEPRKKPSYFPFYWLFNKDPSDGLLYHHIIGQYHDLSTANDQGFDHCSHVVFLEQRSISTRNNPHLRLRRHPTISQALGPQSVNFRKSSYTRDWSKTTPLTNLPPQGLIKPALVSLNKALFLGRGGVR